MPGYIQRINLSLYTGAELINRERKVKRKGQKDGRNRVKTAALRKIISDSDNIVFFGGAGVSTESGIPDFSQCRRLYHQKYADPPETILSHTFYRRKKEEFYRFYHEKMLVTDALPNAGSRKLAQLEQQGKLKRLHRILTDASESGQ